MHANLAGQTMPTHTNEFTLTQAVQPASNAQPKLFEGYRVQVYRDQSRSLRLPMLSASVTAAKLFDAFLALLEPLGDEVHVVLESSHRTRGNRHQDYRRNRIDRPVLMSHFCTFEDLLLNDGCTGVAVLSARRPMEVQFDEHKVLSVYAPRLRPFRAVLHELGLRRAKSLTLISELEHLHCSKPEYDEQFQELRRALGVMDFRPSTRRSEDHSW